MQEACDLLNKHSCGLFDTPQYLQSCSSREAIDTRRLFNTPQYLLACSSREGEKKTEKDTYWGYAYWVKNGGKRLGKQQTSIPFFFSMFLLREWQRITLSEGNYGQSVPFFFSIAWSD